MVKTKEPQLNVKSRKPNIANISGIMGVSLVCLLSVTGCDWLGNKSDDDKPVNEETKAPEAKTPEAKTPEKKVAEGGVELEPVITAANTCSDLSIKDKLTQSVQTLISQQSQTLASTYAQNAKVTLDSNNINANNVSISIDNIKVSSNQPEGSNASCQATVKMTLSADDVTRANQLYAGNRLKSLEQRLAGSSITLDGSTLTDENFTFTMNAKRPGSMPQISGQPIAIVAVADVVASSEINRANFAKLKAQQKRKDDIARKRRQAKIAKQKAEEKQRAEMARQKKADELSKNEVHNYSLAEGGLSENSVKSKEAFKAKEKSPTQEQPVPTSKTTVTKAPIVKNDNIKMVVVEENGVY